MVISFFVIWRMSRFANKLFKSFELRHVGGAPRDSLVPDHYLADANAPVVVPSFSGDSYLLYEEPEIVNRCVSLSTC